jgi:hypothetical protein
LLSLSFLFTEVAVLSVSHAVIVGFGGCSAWLTLSCNASSGRLYVSTSPDLCPLLDFTHESVFATYSKGRQVLQKIFSE